MRILHFILGKANPDRANGVNQVVYGLAKHQTQNNDVVTVVGVSKSMTIDYELVDRTFFKVHAFKNFNKAFEYIKNDIENIDIVHLHGVWNFMNIKLGKYLESINKPYIITAHCGYSEDRLKQSNYWIKLLYHKFWQKHLFENSAGIHAITREEATDIAKYCNHQNIFVIPNGMDQAFYSNKIYKVKRHSKIKLGYVGRLSVEKNIDNLIKAIALLPNNIQQKIELYLIGPINSKTYKLQQLVTSLNIENIVHFTNGIYGEEKIQTLLDLDIYIHPAYSDVVGISVIEALSLGIPTIVTRTSHMSYYFNSNAFIMVEPTSFDLCRGIIELYKRQEDWAELSVKARQLAQEQFNWVKIVKHFANQFNNIVK